VCRANLLAHGAGFMSLGTNDLTAAILGVDRFAPGVSLAHHPRVLGAIAATVRASHRVGIRVEVCGEAASDPTALPLLVGLGVDELSVGASHVDALARSADERRRAPTSADERRSVLPGDDSRYLAATRST